jgi:hypothetical protein
VPDDIRNLKYDLNKLKSKPNGKKSWRSRQTLRSRDKQLSAPSRYLDARISNYDTLSRHLQTGARNYITPRRDSKARTSNYHLQTGIDRKEQAIDAGRRESQKQRQAITMLQAEAQKQGQTIMTLLADNQKHGQAIRTIQADIQKYKMKKLKTISDESSGTAEELSSLKRGVHCLKYEMTKLKSLSNEIAREVPFIEKSHVGFALRSDIGNIRTEAKDAKDQVPTLASEPADMKKSAKDATNAVQEPQRTGPTGP